MKNYSIKIFAAIYIILLASNFFWFVSGSPALQTESAIRTALGSLLIFILPGLIWGEILGFKSEHLLETIALSFALTMVIEIILLPVPFLFHSTIRLWIWLLLGVSLCGMVIFILRSKDAKEMVFINPVLDFLREPSQIKYSVPLITGILIILSYGAYSWGENIADIDGEKLLHLTFVRYYNSMPMIFHDLGIYKGQPPLNLVQLWEYLVAGWASLINMDPLLLFYRARFVIPLLGFSGMYFLISKIFTERIKSEIIFWGVFIMSIGWFALLSPSGLDWIKADPFRGVMSFMGTAHHADSAMEILIPLNAGLVLMAFRKPGWRSFLLLTGVLTATFTWHVREFFQAAIYAGIFGAALLLIPNTDRKAMLRKWGLAMAAFLVVIVFFSGAMFLIAPKQSQGYDELKLKTIALSYALQDITDIRSLFNFPADLRLTQGLDKNTLVANEQLATLFKNSWNFFLWLILSALAVPLLTIRGDKEDKHLSLFYILLWFLTLCWSFSQLLLIVFTYSEINFTTPRMLYVFSYIVIASALYAIFQLVYEKISKPMHWTAYFAGVFIAGLIVKLWWSNGLPLARTISAVLSILFIISFVLLLNPKMPQFSSLKTPNFPAAVLGIFIFFVPILGKEYTTVIPKVIAQGRQPVEWFSDKNPWGFSKELIQFMKSVPVGQTFMVDPLGKAAISVYAPQYAAIVPEFMGITLVNSREVYAAVRQGKNPLFITNASITQFNPDYITKAPYLKANFLDWKGPDTILNDIAKAAPPMVLHSRSSDFNFTRIPGKGGNIIRVSPAPGNKSVQRGLSFGYALNDNGFNPNVRPGQLVIFSISARLTGNARKPAQLFVLDRSQTAEISGDNIKGSSWRQYSVSKTMRDNINYVAFGVQWQPENENEWLEISNVRIYILDSLIGNYSSLVLNIDQKAANEMLDRYKTDYILIESKFYSGMLPYFSRYPSTYNIVFNNKERGELVVRYLRKTA